MTVTLILTVGGAHQPILASLRQHRPERIHFLCSADQGKTKGSYTQVTGEGKVLKSDRDLEAPDLPCIATLAGLQPGSFQVHLIEGFDDLDSCYLASARVIVQARAETPGGRLLADYTGGTKSMSAGLVAAALDDGRCELALVVGQRVDLVKVVNRTEFARRVPVTDTQIHRRIAAARELVARYDYAAAEQILRDAAAELGSSTSLGRLQRGIALCRAFDDWDRFEHGAARDCLAAYQGEFGSHWRVLRALCGETPSHGFEWVEDLLRNAERRHAQGRFDDAVGRVYRALELAAQVWLKDRHGIDTSDVDVGRVPEAARAGLERQREDGRNGQPGKIKIGLRQAWELIAAFAADPLGALYVPRSQKLLAFLRIRNDSLFAHGYRPITRADHDRHVPGVAGWLRETVAAGLAAMKRKRPVELEQFPTDFLESP
jgi:CRISPR-associated protein (TIGR02710 family)